MKLWWLRIYTLPSLKRYALPLGVWALANALCAAFLPKVRELTFLVAMYPWYVFLNNNDQTLAGNIEFHRTHLRYRELRLAVFLDLLLGSGTFLFLFLMTGYFFWKDLNQPIRVFEVFGTPTLALLIWCLGLLFLMSPKLGIYKQTRDHQHRSRQREDYLRMGLVALPFLFLGYLFTKGVSTSLLGLIAVGGALSKFFFDWYEANFHPWFRKSSWIISLHAPLGMVLLLGFIFSIAPRVREETAQKIYTKEERLHSFNMFRNLGFEVDGELAADLLEADSAPLYAHHIFSHATDEVFEKDLDTVIRRPSYRLYAAYLASGRAQDHNLRVLFTRSLQGSKDWQHERHYEQFRRALVQIHPEAKVLPERKIASKKEKKR